MASTATTSARTLLSRSFAAARQAMAARPAPRPPVRVIAPPVRAGPRSSLIASTRWYSSSSSSSSTPSSPSSSSTASSDAAPSTPESPALGAPAQEGTGETTKQPLGKIEPRLSLTFTCQAGPEREMPVCGHRSSHEFAKKSYEKGVVIIQCPECKARHLIADNLGWFNVTEDGKYKTVEDLVKAKGGKVTTGKVNFDGDIEYAPE